MGCHRLATVGRPHCGPLEGRGRSIPLAQLCVIKLVMEMQISATQFDSVSPKAHISSQNKFNWKETDCYYYIC